MEYYTKVMNMGAKNRLREIRHEMMIDKQTEMAELLGIAPNQYNRYEKQSGQPTLEVILRIARRLNRRVEEIFYLEDDPL